MTTSEWIILVALWLASVVSMFYCHISSQKESKKPYTFGHAIADLFLGSIGCGLVPILILCGEALVICVCLIVYYLAKLVSPIINKRIL